MSVDIVQGTPQWFAARLGKATASCFVNVLAAPKSVARRNYIAKLALEIVTGEKDGGYQTAAMTSGIEREGPARKMYQNLTGELVDETGFWLHDTLDAGASPDGLVGEDGLIEIKCPSPGVYLSYLHLPAEPPEYTAQIQGQLWITGRKWCDFVSYHPDFPEEAQLIVRRIPRDDAYIATLSAAVAAFMEEVRAEVSFIRNYRNP